MNVLCPYFAEDTLKFCPPLKTKYILERKNLFFRGVVGFGGLSRTT